MTRTRTTGSEEDSMMSVLNGIAMWLGYCIFAAVVLALVVVGLSKLLDAIFLSAWPRR